MRIRKLKRRKNRKSQKIKKRVEFLHSGCTTLNLALSGKGKNGGWARGRIDNIVGDKSSGKTLCALEVAFWCYKNIKKIKSKIFPKVKKKIIVYNNREGVMDFPIELMYGKNFENAVEWISTKTIEAMGRDFLRRLKKLKKGEFLLYIADSWDSFNSAAGEKRMKKSIKEDKEIDGSYNMEKQKWASMDFFPYCTGQLKNNKKDATLFIISQTRNKIDTNFFGKKTKRTGGKALDFYTHQVAWIREIEKMAKTKLKNKRVYGIRSGVKVEKSKVSKPFRESNFTILFDYGIDDINSMTDFIYGSKNKSFKFNNEKFKTKLSLIKYIEKNNLEEKLVEKTERKWHKIENAFAKEIANRKKRY